MDISVSIKNVYKKYKMHTSQMDKVKDILLPKGYGEDFYAVRNVSFDAYKGDVIGLIGVNGSGKSTLSNMIAGIVPQTYGTIETEGEISLIAVAAGLNGDLTGRENIELKCLMMGYSKQQIKEMEPDIIEFADIGKFIDQPVKKYSSGMRSRLGFAISVTVDPDILIIDEALSVGDRSFADKCLSKMKEFKERGKTIFFVSHSIGQVKEFCTKAVWLEYGEIKAYGDVKEVAEQYEKFLNEYKKFTKEQQKQFREEAIRKQEGKEDNMLASHPSVKREKKWFIGNLVYYAGVCASVVFLALRLFNQ